MNPNNCETCDYKHMQSSDQADDDGQLPNDSGHCYMFEDEPHEVCMQHTERKSQGRKALETLMLLGMMMNKSP